jgi:murein DD-endopeptidase MepM/ murein hydrolase activator NlpD
MRLVQPWPEPYTINKRSPYGPRVHPITGKRTFHHGIDIAMPVGTRLTAPAPGTVVHKGNNGSGGVTLIIRHEGNMHTVYYHLQRPSHLPIGATVQTGDEIAFSGNTGASTGPHLHMELRRSRAWGDTLDPQPHIVKPVTVAPVEIADILPEPEPVPRPETVEPPAKPKPPVFDRPISADHMERIVKKFGNFGRRGWFGG